MNREEVKYILKKIKESSKKRKFTQSVDFIINLRGIDLKKTEQAINSYITLHFPRGKKVRVCAFVGPELLEQAKSVCDKAVSIDDFRSFESKIEAKKLAEAYDYFIAQVTIMPKVATTFGKILGPKGKMPNPKAGCVVPPNVNLKPLVERLQSTVRLQTKNDPIIQVSIGNEGMKEEEIADNVMTIYDALVHQLPGGKDNIRSVYLKLTMGKPIKVGEKEEAGGEKAKEKKKPKPGKAEAKKETEKENE